MYIFMLIFMLFILRIYSSVIARKEDGWCSVFFGSSLSISSSSILHYMLLSILIKQCQIDRNTKEIPNSNFIRRMFNKFTMQCMKIRKKNRSNMEKYSSKGPHWHFPKKINFFCQWAKNLPKFFFENISFKIIIF